MGYFNYHAKLQQKIKEIGICRAEFRDEYHGISPVMLIYLNDGSVYPIREHMFDTYINMINNQTK